MASAASLRELFDGDSLAQKRVTANGPPGLTRSGSSALPESVSGTSTSAAEFHPIVFFLNA